MKLLVVLLVLFALPAVVLAEGKRPMKIDDLFAFRRVSDPQISPDGKWVVYVVGTVDLPGNKIPSSLWLASHDGKQIAFVSAVYPEYSEKPFKESDEANKKRKEEIEKNPVKAKVFTKLFYRHWVDYVEDKRQHLFVLPIGARSVSEGFPRDVTP